MLDLRSVASALNFRACPILVPLLCAVAGILVFEGLPQDGKLIHWGYAAALWGVVLGGGWLFRNVYLGYGGGAWFVGFLALALYLHQDRRPDQVFASETDFYRAYLVETPRPSSYGYGYILLLAADLSYREGHGLRPVDERLRLRYSGLAMPWSVGDEFWIRGAPKLIQASDTQLIGYNYAASQWRVGIYFEDYANRKDIIVTGRRRGNWIWVGAQRFKAQMRATLSMYLPRESAHLAEGLLLGERHGLSTALEEAFFATGSMHILAVSGLHVGILYGFWMFCLAFLPLGRYTRVVRFVSTLLLLWGFAFVVGLSHSVVRATIFGTLLVGSNWIGRRSNSYNTLFAAALLILLFDPNALFALSFQLSFLGVLGILLFYRPLYRWISDRYAFLRPFWAMICISLAAQIATFPLVVYYFHQLSLIFPLSSIFLTLLLFLILPLSLGVALLGSWALVAKGLAYLLDILLKSMSFITQEMASWPLSHLHPIYIDQKQLGLLYAALFLVLCFLMYRRAIYLLLCCGFLALNILMGHLRFARALESQGLWLQVHRSGAMSLQYLDRGIAYRTEGTEKSTSASYLLLRDGYLHSFCSLPLRAQLLLPVVKDHLYATQVGDKKLLYLRSSARKLEQKLRSKYRFSSDYLVLHRQSEADVPLLRQRFSFKTLILGATSSGIAKDMHRDSVSVHLSRDPFYEKLLTL